MVETAEAVYVPVTVLREIRAGFRHGRRAVDNEKRLTWFLAQEGIAALGIEPAVSHRYATIHRALRAKGAPIPTGDLRITAVAAEHGLVLYTRDAHFEGIPGLACL